MASVYEIGIIGGGPAGYHAALEAAREGISVVLIEKRKPGGVCLFDGCIPTKSLVTSTKAYFHLLKDGVIRTEQAVFDWKAAAAKKDKDIKKLSAGLAMQLKQQQIPVIEATGKINSITEEGVVLQVGEEQILVENVILATGSENVIPPIPGLREVMENGNALDSTGILTACRPSSQLVVIGAGVIGLEIASIYANVGTKVTVLERESHFLEGLDDELKAEYLKALSRKGVKVLLGQEVDAVKQVTADTLEIQAKNSTDDVIQTFTADLLLVATGRRSVFSACTQEQMKQYGIQLKNGHIVTDMHGQTGNPRIFACGDIADKNMLAYTAGLEGEHTVRYIKARKSGAECRQPAEAGVIPAVVFSNPEAAYVGMTEQQCKQQGIAYKTAVCTMNYSSLFMIENERENGAFKIIYMEQDGRLLGCHMLGNGASEVIGTIQAYIADGKTVSDIENMPIMHPSKLEVVKEVLHVKS